MARKFLDWKWAATTLAAIEIAILYAVLISAVVYAPWIIKILGVLITLIISVGVYLTINTMVGRKPPLTAEEALAEEFCEYKRGEEEDRA